jgi:hypothetical protein
MIYTLSVPAKVTDGLAMPAIHFVLLTTLLTRELSERLTLQEIYLEMDTLTSCLTLQTKFGLPQRPGTSASSTSYSTRRFAQRNPYGVGAHIVESIRMLNIAIFLLQKRVTTMVRFLKSHYSEENK